MSEYRYYEPDSFDKDGAAKLAQRIQSYWAERGYTVQAEAHYRFFHRSMRSGFYVVRSDLKNGLPPEARQ